jgi:hypothetical protein
LGRGLFLCPQNRRRITQKTAAQWQYAAGKVAQAEIVFRLSHAIVVACDSFLNIPSDIGRRDSARPAHASIQAKGYPMADKAAERVSESPRPPAILHATFYFLSNPREEALRRSDHPASTKCAPTGNRGIASSFALPEAAGIRHDLSECQWRNLDPLLGIS